MHTRHMRSVQTHADSQVYSLHPDTGEIYAHMGRDFVVSDSDAWAMAMLSAIQTRHVLSALQFTGVTPQLNENILLADLQRMLWLRLLALDYLGVQVSIPACVMVVSVCALSSRAIAMSQVVVETGLGLGVFAGDKIGVGARVRGLSARALWMVLDEERQLRHGARADESAQTSPWHWRKRAFRNIQCIILALPLFGPLFARSNYHFFEAEFSRHADNGGCPVWVVDNDMHALALKCAAHGFSVSELNPADSHGVFGEYWQNRGPGTEEKLALTTLGLLTQHHACNPYVTDTTRHHIITM